MQVELQQSQVMPFKKFPDEVVFGNLPSASNASNGNASSAFKKNSEPNSKQGDASTAWSTPSENSRRSLRNKSPSRTSVKDATGTNCLSSFTDRPFSSSLGPSAPKLYDWAARTEDGPNTLLPLHQSVAAVGGPFQKSRSPVLVDNNHLSKSPPRLLHAHVGNPKSVPPPASGMAKLPPAASQVSNSSQIREPRTRHSSPQDQTSRLFASAVQQFRPTEDGNDISLSAEHQRDEMAKGRRLRRFNADIDSTAKASQTVYHLENQNEPDQVVRKRAKGGNKFFGSETRDYMLDHLTEAEGPDTLAERDWQSVEAILGSCPDMCPESERHERERKGDLDRLERLDGDRNQTSRDFAVKKYTRTAEKHSSLIRPISVLLMTMEHLLRLLNRGYDDELLNLHNFLWDRMRAIRMDLRMQHIFNQHAVTMHEQMIRFHILAMHELCEYAKGEGFSEGFDAHLNIEQMNKASVDLFHMYDDLRKSGNSCACEAEFRGYYALLKLDKHPGYVVEPAELSLDLAKMTPEMRNAPEVQFARKVARACRLGNYLAFFRLARDATYLQACLMHAHFSKLRSHAMASLHSGLQRNQGIPLLQVEDWVAMEGEDIEALVEYHGFSLKNYEELYMVKEGPFLNNSRDFQTCRSKLVEEKRSQKVRDDVLSSGQQKASTVPILEKISSFRRQSDSHPTGLALVDEEMPDYEEEEQPCEDVKAHLGVFVWQLRDESIPNREAEVQMPAAVLPMMDPVSGGNEQECSVGGGLEQDEESEWFCMGKRRKSFSANGENFGHKPDEHIVMSRDKKLRTFKDISVVVGSQVPDVVEVSEPVVEADHHKEEKERQAALEAEAKVRRLFRKWKARAALKAEERRWRQQKLEAALGSFHLGLPVQSNEKVLFPAEDHASSTGSSGLAMELDITQTENRRLDRLERMWAQLDVTGVVASVLKGKSPACKFLCWKLVMCSRVHDFDLSGEGRCDKAGEWLLAKIFHQMPSERENVEGLSATVVSHDVICMSNQDDRNETPIFYIARDLYFRHSEVENTEACQGASGLLFLVSQSAPLTEERGRLHAFVNTLHVGVKLPLLVLFPELPEAVNAGTPNFSGNPDEADAVALVLDMDVLDKNKVACWTVLPIMESYQTACPSNAMEKSYGEDIHLSSGKGLRGFYSEDMLKKGISWLASKAPRQPDLRCVQVQNLVMEHLQPCIKLLLAMEPEHVTPEMCVKTFNEALLKTASEINNTAASCYLHWPPDELRKVLKESMWGRTLLIPSPGWNKVTSLQPILEILYLSQLPQFPPMSSTIQSLGSSTSLKKQKVALEQMLHCYVNQICALRPGDLLTLQVVNAIIQKGCIFKQTVTGRLLVPNWALIFQQLYHMRLAFLISEPPTVVWVQTRPELHERQGMTMSPNFTQHTGPTLDDMIEMESHEEAVSRRDPNDNYMVRDDAVLMEKIGRLSVLQVSEISNSEYLTQDSSVALQESLAVGRKTGEFARLVEVPTEGELELESMVNEFCRRVDQEVAEAAEVEDGQASFCYEAQHANDQCAPWNAGAGQMDENADSNMLFVDSFVDDLSSYAANSYSWATSDGMDNLTKLLQCCEHVQNNLDRKLKECLRTGEAVRP